ncbi:MAG TPA: GNAT family protein [Bacteroidia bacterium]|nr:GNAT family protein [Bacteroidia bacterium]
MSSLASQITLSTNRMLLKSITPAIINELFITKNKQEIISYFGFEEPGYEHLKSMVEQGMEAYRVTSFYFLLIDKDSQKVLGECGYHTWSIPHRRAELFYSLRNENDKRKGYMSEALKVILNYGFNELGIHRVAALTAPSNEASIALLKHYGFVKEGIHRQDYVVNGVNEDSICFSLLKWEWEKQLADEQI